MLGKSLRSRPSDFVVTLLLLAIATAVYWPGLSGGFLFDDYPNIVTNRLVHLEAISLASLQAAAGGYEASTYGRPLATLGFAFDYFIGHKEPWGYKVHSLVVHCLNTLLVFWLTRRILGHSRIGTGQARWHVPAAFAVSLLWAIHPLQVSTVLYVVQRMEMLSLTFVLLALLAYLRGREAHLTDRHGWAWLLLSGVLAAIGLLSKESAVLFPFYSLGLELTLFRFDARNIRDRKALRLAYCIGLTALAIGFFFWLLPQYTAPDAYSGRDFSLQERLLSQLRILPMYLGQMMLPLPGSLTFYYDAYPKSEGWLAPATTLGGAALLLAIVSVAWRARDKAPLFALGVSWFFAAHLLTSNVINLELAFEHRNYFALLGILLALADLVRRIPMSDGPNLKWVAVGAVILAFGFLAALRAATWGDPLLLATDLASKTPGSARASSDLATLYVGMSDSDPDSPFFHLGQQEFERGSRLPGSSPLPEQGLIVMAATTGQPVRTEWWVSLIHKVRTRPIGPQETMAVTGLLERRYEGIPLDDAYLETAVAALIERAPSATLYARYGDYALTYLGNRDLARRMFLEAVNLSRDDPSYAPRLAGILLQEGHPDLAAEVITRAAELGLPSR